MWRAPAGGSLHADDEGLAMGFGLGGGAGFVCEALGFFFAVEDAEDAFGEGLQLVFAGIDVDGGDPS